MSCVKSEYTAVLCAVCVHSTDNRPTYNHCTAVLRIAYYVRAVQYGVCGLIAHKTHTYNNVCVVSSRVIAHCLMFTVTVNLPNDELRHLQANFTQSEAFMFPVCASMCECKQRTIL